MLNEFTPDKIDEFTNTIPSFTEFINKLPIVSDMKKLLDK